MSTPRARTWSQSSSAACSVVLDAGRLAQLRVFTDGELRQITRGAIDSISEQLTRLGEALPAGELRSAAEAAHRGKNETLLVGARELCAAFTELEDRAREGNLQGAERAAGIARGVWPQTRSAIERIVEGERQPVAVAVSTEDDIAVVRNTAREVASAIGFSGRELTVIATAISEVARNIAMHASPGEITMGPIESEGRFGIRIQADDHGPGIEDVELALKDGYSTIQALGIGLPSARRLMDEFELVSGPDSGTTVTMAKWRT